MYRYLYKYSYNISIDIQFNQIINSTQHGVKDRMNSDFRARILRHIDRLLELNGKPFKTLEETKEQKQLINEISKLLVDHGYDDIRQILPIDKIYEDRIPLATKIADYKESYRKNLSELRIRLDQARTLQDRVFISIEILLLKTTRACVILNSVILKISKTINNVSQQIEQVSDEIAKNQDLNRPSHHNSSHKKKFKRKDNNHHGSNYFENDPLGKRYLKEFRNYTKDWSL